MVGSVEIDIEINPLSLRRYLEFFVASNVLEICADKSLGNIPVPELVRLGRCVGIGLQIQFFIRAYEKNVEIPLRPARPDFRSILRESAPVRVRLQVDGL